jgi:RNA polymerase sigma-70 factor, ECF subfamily
VTDHLPLTDTDLLEKISQSDQRALAALYERYSGIVFSLAMRTLSNQGMAEEVTQDTFMKVWRHPRAYNPALGKFSSWLLTLTRYTAIDRLRHEIRQSGASTALDDAAELGQEDDALDDPTLFDGQRMRALLHHLPPEQSQAIELAFFQGMSREQIALQTAVPIGTVKTRLRLGLQKLKTMWEKTLSE